MSEQSRRSLAVRYRPRTFADLVGQRHVAAVLGAAIEADKVPQQILLMGGSGLGKTTVARIAAAAILCETPLDQRPHGDACGTCETCRDVTDVERSHPDVIELDAASNGGKDEIRELAQRAAFAPLRGRFKIYIIDEAQGLTSHGGEAFLKLQEEPPAHCIFMMATTDPQKMLKTTIGRCEQFELLRPTDDELVANLRRVAAGEGWTLSDRAARAVLASTDSALGVRGTVMTLEKLAGPLAAGVDPDDDTLAVLLGVAPAALVADLTTAVGAFDRPAALTALTALRARSSNAAIRTALLTWAREGFTASLRPESPVASELALWRYETLAAAPAGDMWTDIVVARLAAPRLQPDAQTLSAMLAQAEHVIAQLTDALTHTAAASAPTSRTSSPAPTPQAEAFTPGASRSVGGQQPPTPTSGEAPSTQAGATATAPAGGAIASGGGAEQFADLVGAHSKVAAAMLRSCTVAVDGADIVVTTTPALATRFRAGGQQALFELTAGELGYNLRIVTT